MTVETIAAGIGFALMALVIWKVVRGGVPDAKGQGGEDYSQNNPDL